MSDNFRKLNIHFDIESIRNAYNIAVEDIGFKGDLVNCISLTHTGDTEDEGPLLAAPAKRDDRGRKNTKKSLSKKAKGKTYV